MAEAVILSDLPDRFGEHFMPHEASLRQRIRAKMFANESYIQSVKLYRGKDSEVDIKAVVYRSQRQNDEGHRINMSVGRDRVTDAICSCKAGVGGDCAHVLAVVLKVTDWILEGLTDVPSQPACTSMPQQWDRPRGHKIEAEPVSTMVIAKPGNTSRKTRPLTADFNDNRKIQLLDSDICHLQSLPHQAPISYLTYIPDQTVLTENGKENVGSALAYQIPLMQPVEINADSSQCPNIHFPGKPTNVQIPAVDSNKLQGVKVTQDEAIQLEINTRDQASNAMWQQERGRRITASNFGRFMVRKCPVTAKFVTSVQTPKKFTSAATSYGSANEKVAKNMYRKKTSNHVHDCGLVINPEFPFIGASPDGKVCDKLKAGILEIKCPFSIRDMTVAEALDNESIRCKLCVEKVGEQIKLKRNHVYWYQVQGQLLVTGAEFCDFVIYTRRDLIIERILPHTETMEAILSKMCYVYSTFIAS